MLLLLYTLTTGFNARIRGNVLHVMLGFSLGDFGVLRPLGRMSIGSLMLLLLLMLILWVRHWCVRYLRWRLGAREIGSRGGTHSRQCMRRLLLNLMR